VLAINSDEVFMLGFLKKALPWISAAATCNVPALTQLAANAVSNAVGKDVDASEEAIAAAVAGAKPEEIAALKQQEVDFALKMQQLGFQHQEELEAIAAGDRSNARAREIALRDRIPAILAIAVTGGFFGLLFVLLRWAPPQQNEALLNISLGSLGTAWVAIISYYFGSSAGSERKSEIIAEIKR
jgi:hypothetical protein